MAQPAKAENTAPRCPNDGAALTPVQAANPQGAVIMLDQCGCCGGIWFDKWELFQVSASEVKGLTDIDLDSLRCPAGKVEIEPLCPRCGEKLRVFTDPHIPANIQMLICHSCEGFWLNHGEAADYADFRGGRLQQAQKQKVAEQYEKMLQSYSRKDYYQAMESFGNQLGGRRDTLTGLPLDGSPAQLARIDEAQDMFFAVMGTIARLLIPWL